MSIKSRIERLEQKRAKQTEPSWPQLTDEQLRRAERELAAWERSMLEGVEPFSIVVGEPPEPIEKMLAEVAAITHERLWKWREVHCA